ncbi:MAG: thioredoxin domain-containing protein [Desulfovibrio sp.]|nr:thioredoxin domain-containing protein [Desulfovibrio sp.]
MKTKLFNAGSPAEKRAFRPTHAAARRIVLAADVCRFPQKPAVTVIKAIIRAAPAILAAFSLSLSTAQCAPSSGVTKDEVRQILKENPDLVLDILKDHSETVLEIAQQGNMLRKRKAMLAQWEQDAKQKKIVNLEGRPFRGNPRAPVTIVAYSDFTCPYCRQAEQTLAQLLKKYEGRIRVAFKVLPKEDPVSVTAARYSTAAFILDPAKGWLFLDALFSGIDQYEHEGEDFIKKTTESLGYDFRKLKAEAGGSAVQQRLDADSKEADGFGITGTPHFLVNDLMIRGAVSRDLFEEAVDKALQLAGKK